MVSEGKSNRRLYYLFLFAVIIIIVFIFLINSTPSLQPVELKNWNVSPQIKSLGINHKQKLFNITLKYILSPSPCADPDLLAIILVTSYYGNVETRSAMRRSFSDEDLEKLSLRRVFLLGESPGDIYTKQESIVNESKRFGDLVQGNFIEAYRNLTYKHVMGLKWASEKCYRAKYVIKMDDDMVVNVQKVVELLHSASFPQNLVAGYVLRKMAPVREPANKWYVTEREYPQPFYPPFVSGWFYITTPRIAAKFFLLSHYFDYFWIDDVYITGILARHLKIKHYDIGKYFTVFPEFLQCCINDINHKAEDCDFLVGPNGGDNNLFYTFNEVVRNCSGVLQKCHKRSKPLNETCVAERKFNVGRGHGAIATYNLH